MLDSTIRMHIYLDTLLSLYAEKPYFQVNYALIKLERAHIGQCMVYESFLCLYPAYSLYIVQFFQLSWRYLCYHHLRVDCPHLAKLNEHFALLFLLAKILPFLHFCLITLIIPKILFLDAKLAKAKLRVGRPHMPPKRIANIQVSTKDIDFLECRM